MQEPFRSWSTLLSVIALLQRRLAANTLLPGAVRQEESDYYAHVIAASFVGQNKPAPHPAVLQIYGPTLGYDVLLDALFRSLNFMFVSSHSLWPTAELKIVGLFVRGAPPFSSYRLLPLTRAGGVPVQVFQALDVIPQTAGIGQHIPSELELVAFVAKHMSPQNFEPTFCAAVLRKWHSDEVSSALRARGALQTGIALHEEVSAGFDDRQREDIAKHGLRDCALPSCSKTEKTVKEFAGCSGCRSVVYCCAEHQGLHWTKHKEACREKEATRLAEEDVNDDTGAAAAAQQLTNLGIS